MNGPRGNPSTDLSTDIVDKGGGVSRPPMPLAPVPVEAAGSCLLKGRVWDIVRGPLFERGVAVRSD